MATALEKYMGGSFLGGLRAVMEPDRADNRTIFTVIRDDQVQTALDARRFGLNTWWLMLILAVATGAVGALLALNPATGAESLTRLLGISLLAEGALNLCVAVCAIKIVAHQRPDAIEGHLI